MNKRNKHIHWQIEIDGMIIGHPSEKPVEEMMIPVKCRHCGDVYDLTEGKPVQRYTDCTVYITPCCKKMVDDREYVANPAFTRLKK